MKVLKVIAASFVAAVLLFGFIPVPANAKISTNLTGLVCTAGNNIAGCGTAAKCAGISDVAQKNACISSARSLGAKGGYLTFIVDTVITIGTIVSIIFILIGAIKFITSTGDSKKVQGARDTVLYAVIGLIVMILARGIVDFVLAKVK